MKIVCETLGVARSNIAARAAFAPSRARVRPPLPDRELVEEIKAIIADMPKWLFTTTVDPIFAIAGIWRETKEVDEAFAMLTTPPGPEIAPYHDRQIVILERNAWAGWLDPTVPARSLIRALLAGTLAVEQIG